MGAGGALTGVGPELCLWEAFVAPDVQHLHGKDSKVKPKDVLSFNQGYTAIAHQTQNQSHSTPYPTPLDTKPAISNTKSNNKACVYNIKFQTKSGHAPIPNLVLNKSHSIPNQIPRQPSSISYPASVCTEPARPNVKFQFPLH